MKTETVHCHVVDVRLEDGLSHVHSFIEILIHHDSGPEFRVFHGFPSIFRYWVQLVTRAFYKGSCQMAVCLWEKAYMGITYDFNLPIYLLAIRIGTPGSWDASTMHTCHICVGVLTILPNMKVVAIVYFS